MPRYLAPLAITTIGAGTLIGTYLLLVSWVQNQQPDDNRNNQNNPFPIPPALLPYLEPTTLALLGVLLREWYYQTVTLALEFKEAGAGAAAAAAAEWADAALARFGRVLLESQHQRRVEGAGGVGGSFFVAVAEWGGHVGRFVLHTETAAEAAGLSSSLPAWGEAVLRLAVRVVLCFVAVRCLRWGKRPLGARRREQQAAKLMQQQQQQPRWLSLEEEEEEEKEEDEEEEDQGQEPWVAATEAGVMLPVSASSLASSSSSSSSSPQCVC
jgi:hypothetical protein